MQSVLEVLVLKQPGAEAITAVILDTLRGEDTPESVIDAMGNGLELGEVENTDSVVEYMVGLQPTLQKLYKAALDARPVDKAAAIQAMTSSLTIQTE